MDEKQNPWGPHQLTFDGVFIGAIAESDGVETAAGTLKTSAPPASVGFGLACGDGPSSVARALSRRLFFFFADLGLFLPSALLAVGSLAILASTAS